MECKADAATAEQLCNVIITNMNSLKVLTVLDDMLQNFCNNECCQPKRYEMIEAIFTALKVSNVSSKQADQIVNRIIVDFPKYSKTQLQRLVIFCINSIRNNDDESASWKTVMPILLEVLQGEKFIWHKNKEMTGLEYKSCIINSICDSDWDPKTLISLAKMFGEISFDTMSPGICDVLKYFCAKLDLVEANEIPPLVHQLLRLSPKQNNNILFTNLSKYFSKRFARFYKSDDEIVEKCESISREEFTLKELQNVQSTVLYHIYQSIQVNQKSLMDFIKSLKAAGNAPEFVFDLFTLSLLLLVLSTSEEEVFKILKMALLRQIQDEENCENCAWLRNALPDNPGIMSFIKRVIENSNSDPLILKGLIDFAFVILSTDAKTMVDKHLTWDFGYKIIQKVLRKRQEAGATILENITYKIIEGGINITQFTVCLAYICQKNTKIVLDYHVWIMTLLDHLLTIPSTAANQVLLAVLPLLRVSLSLRENLVLILRKGLYRKGTQNRQMAVLGFLELLKRMKLISFEVPRQESQFSSSVTASNYSLMSKATVESWNSNSLPEKDTCVREEVFNILSRCFTHEFEVRVQLYRGLYDAVGVNGILSECAINFLLGQFSLYYIADENISLPLLLHKCTYVQQDDAVLQEPLGDLVFSMQRIYVKAAANDSITLENMAKVLESLCKRMVQCELTHLEINDHTNLSVPTPQIQRKYNNVKLMISVYEALIAFRISAWSLNSINVAQSIIDLFKGYTRFAQFLKKPNKTKRGCDIIAKCPNRLVPKLPNTVMDLHIICKLIALLNKNVEDIKWTTKEQALLLKSRVEIHRYALQCCLQILQNTKTLSNLELKSDIDKNNSNYVDIAAGIYNHVVSNLKTIREFDENTAVLSLECLKELCELMCSKLLEHLPKFIAHTCNVDANETLSKQMCSLVQPLNHLLISNLKEEENQEMVAGKIPVLLIKIISRLATKISFDDLNKNDKPFEFLQEIAKNYESVDPQVALMIVELILNIEERSEDYGENIDDFCEDFCSIYGILDNREVQNKTFKIVHEKTIQQAYIIVNKILNHKMQTVQCLLGRLSSEHFICEQFGSIDVEIRNSIKAKEKKMCEQFSKILQHLEMLAIAKIEPGLCSDAIFKNLQKAYILGSSVVKYFHKRSTVTFTAFEGTKFKEMVVLAGKSMKSAVKELILHIERSQNVGTSNDVNVQKNKVLKEVKIIPLVTQAADAFDNDILLLDRKTKSEISMHIEPDSIRDFRMKRSQVVENIEAMNTCSMMNPECRRPVIKSTITYESEVSSLEINSSKRLRLSDISALNE